MFLFLFSFKYQYFLCYFSPFPSTFIFPGSKDSPSQFQGDYFSAPKGSYLLKGKITKKYSKSTKMQRWKNILLMYMLLKNASGWCTLAKIHTHTRAEEVLAEEFYARQLWLIVFIHDYHSLSAHAMLSCRRSIFFHYPLVWPCDCCWPMKNDLTLYTIIQAEVLHARA